MRSAAYERRSAPTHVTPAYSRLDRRYSLSVRTFGGPRRLTSPSVSTFKLEEGVGRVRFTVDRPDDAESVHLRLRFFDKQKKWLADQLVEAWGFDAPILPIAGLFDPSTVTSVECTIDGYGKKTEMLGVQPFVAVASPNASGRKPCPDPRGLIVNGGDDADFEAAVAGPESDHVSDARNDRAIPQRPPIVIRRRCFLSHRQPRLRAARSRRRSGWPVRIATVRQYSPGLSSNRLRAVARRREPSVLLAHRIEDVIAQ